MNKSKVEYINQGYKIIYGYAQTSDYRMLLTKLESKKEPKGLAENHHKVPKSMGGGDEPENIIRLSIEDHYEAHRVLFVCMDNTKYPKYIEYMRYGLENIKDRLDKHTYSESLKKKRKVKESCHWRTFPTYSQEKIALIDNNQLIRALKSASKEWAKVKKKLEKIQRVLDE